MSNPTTTYEILAVNETALPAIAAMIATVSSERDMHASRVATVAAVNAAEHAVVGTAATVRDAQRAVRAAVRAAGAPHIIRRADGAAWVLFPGVYEESDDMRSVVNNLGGTHYEAL